MGAIFAILPKGGGGGGVGRLIYTTTTVYTWNPKKNMVSHFVVAN